MKKLRVATLGLAAAFALLVAAPAMAQTTVKVTAGKPGEFRYVLSAKSVKRGTVTFKVTNAGAIVHDFKINGKATKVLKKGQSQTITVKFAKPGSYQYVCTVAGHAAAGMKGVLRVT